MTYIVTDNENIFYAYQKNLQKGDVAEWINTTQEKMTPNLATGNKIFGYVPIFLAALAHEVTIGLPRLNEYGEVEWKQTPETFSVKKVDESSFSLGETIAPILIVGKNANEIFSDLKKSRDLSRKQEKNAMFLHKNYVQDEEAFGKNIIAENISYRAASKGVLFSQVSKKLKGENVPYYIVGRYKVKQVTVQNSSFKAARIPSKRK